MICINRKCFECASQTVVLLLNPPQKLYTDHSFIPSLPFQMKRNINLFILSIWLYFRFEFRLGIQKSQMYSYVTKKWWNYYFQFHFDCLFGFISWDRIFYLSIFCLQWRNKNCVNVWRDFLHLLECKSNLEMNDLKIEKNYMIMICTTIG